MKNHQFFFFGLAYVWYLECVHRIFARHLLLLLFVATNIKNAERPAFLFGLHFIKNHQLLLCISRRSCVVCVMLLVFFWYLYEDRRAGCYCYCRCRRSVCKVKRVNRKKNSNALAKNNNHNQRDKMFITIWRRWRGILHEAATEVGRWTLNRKPKKIQEKRQWIKIACSGFTKTKQPAREEKQPCETQKVRSMFLIVFSLNNMCFVRMVFFFLSGRCRWCWFAGQHSLALKICCAREAQSKSSKLLLLARDRRSRLEFDLSWIFHMNFIGCEMDEDRLGMDEYES